jgi:hypothetical protein
MHDVQLESFPISAQARLARCCIWHTQNLYNSMPSVHTAQQIRKQQMHKHQHSTSDHTPDAYCFYIPAAPPHTHLPQHDPSPPCNNPLLLSFILGLHALHTQAHPPPHTHTCQAIAPLIALRQFAPGNVAA